MSTINLRDARGRLLWRSFFADAEAGVCRAFNPAECPECKGPAREVNAQALVATPDFLTRAGLEEAAVLPEELVYNGEIDEAICPTCDARIADGWLPVDTGDDLVLR